VAEDIDEDPNPVASFSQPGNDYAFTVTNRESNGASLVIASVLDAN
jgi:hypothetical protein